MENCLPKILDRLKILSATYPNKELRETARNLLESVNFSNMKTPETVKNSNYNESSPKFK